MANPWQELLDRLGSQARACEAVGVSEGLYSRYRRGERHPSPRRALTLAVRLSEVLAREVTPLDLIYFTVDA